MSTDTITQPGPSTRDALEELRSDHRRIERVLADCERLVDGDDPASQADRSALVARLGALLQAHLRLKHEVFEPALRTVAAAGHAHAQGHDDLLARLAALSAAEPHAGGFAHALGTLATAWRAHVRDEEAQQFPAAQQAAAAHGVDLLALGAAIAQRRGELLGDQGVD